MKGIFNAIKDFFGIIIGIFEFIFKALLLLFELLGKAATVLFNVITILPTPLLIGAIALIAVCIVLKVLGRE